MTLKRNSTIGELRLIVVFFLLICILLGVIGVLVWSHYRPIAEGPEHPALTPGEVLESWVGGFDHHHGRLNIGVGPISDTGSGERRLSVVLWVVFDDQAWPENPIRAQVGQVLYFENYRVRVLRLEEGFRGSPGKVTIAILEQ